MDSPKDKPEVDTADPRPFGLGKGLAEISDSFDDPLPDELLDLFEGKGDKGGEV